jgi:hypothetical protein
VRTGASAKASVRRVPVSLVLMTKMRFPRLGFCTQVKRQEFHAY